MAEDAETTNKVIIKEGEGVAVVELDEYRAMQQKLREYEQKMEAAERIRSLRELTEWGEQFARERGITKEQVVEDD